jgi:hypothetical protein
MEPGGRHVTWRAVASTRSAARSPSAVAGIRADEGRLDVCAN